MNKVSLSNVFDQSIARGRRVDVGDKGDDEASSKENAKPNAIVVINPYRKNGNGSQAATVRNPYEKANATNAASCEKQQWGMANKKVRKNISNHRDVTFSDAQCVTMFFTGDIGS